MMICYSMPSIQVVWGLLRLLDDADPLCLGFVGFFLHKNHFLRWFQDRGRLSRPAFFLFAHNILEACSSRIMGKVVHGFSGFVILMLCFIFAPTISSSSSSSSTFARRLFFTITWMRIPVGLGLVYSQQICGTNSTLNKPQRLSVMDCDSIVIPFLLEMFKCSMHIYMQ